MTSFGGLEASRGGDWSVHHRYADRKAWKCSVSCRVCVATPGRAGTGRGVRKERGEKVEGGAAIEKDVADSGDTVPGYPLAFNRSTGAPGTPVWLLDGGHSEGKWPCARNSCTSKTSTAHCCRFSPSRMGTKTSTSYRRCRVTARQRKQL